MTPNGQLLQLVTCDLVGCEVVGPNPGRTNLIYNILSFVDREVSSKGAVVRMGFSASCSFTNALCNTISNCQFNMPYFRLILLDRIKYVNVTKLYLVVEFKRVTVDIDIKRYTCIKCIFTNSVDSNFAFTRYP